MTPIALSSVFSIRIRQKLQRKSSCMKFTAFSKLKKEAQFAPPTKISEMILTVWRCHNKNDLIVASSISPCKTYSPIGILCDELHAVFCWFAIWSIVLENIFAIWMSSQQNANTLYCGCWLFQYNKGRRKIYVFFPKEANFCEHCRWALPCSRVGVCRDITPGTLPLSESVSRSGWPP